MDDTRSAALGIGGEGELTGGLTGGGGVKLHLDLECGTGSEGDGQTESTAEGKGLAADGERGNLNGYGALIEDGDGSGGDLPDGDRTESDITGDR